MLKGTQPPFNPAIPGVFAGAVTEPSISGTDNIHLGFSGVGVGLLDVVVTIWLKLASTA